MQDEDYAVNYYTEEWPKDSNKRIGFLYPNSLIQSTKDCYFLYEKNMNTVSIHLMNIWFKLKEIGPDFLDLMDNKETKDKTVILKTRNKI